MQSFLGKLFELNYGALFRNLEGLTHEESLVEPRPGGNSINWVLGHITASRNRILPLLGQAQVWSREQMVLYSGRDEAGWSAERALHLDVIKTDLARSQQMLMRALDDVTDASLAVPTESGQPLRDALGFSHFHESYHGGQIALLRRLLGHPGVIKPPVTGRGADALRPLGAVR